MIGFPALPRRLSAALLFTAPLLLTACASRPLEPYTTDSVPLVLLPAERAGIVDQRGRFREISCAVLEARKEQTADYRSCEDALVRLGEEPPGTGAEVNLGGSLLHLTAVLIPGIGWDCMENWLNYEDEFAEHLNEYGFNSIFLRVDGRSGTANNARQIRDAIIERAASIAPRSLVLIGYSKGAPDALTAIVDYPEIHPYVAAVVSAAGAVGGSPLANSATEGQLELLKHIPDAECPEGDGHAVESLRPAVRQQWLQQHPLPRSMHFYSVVTYPLPERISSILEPSHRKLAQIDPRNDSQVIFYDQVIPGSTLLAYLNADHWAVAVPIAKTHPFIGRSFVDRNDFPRAALTEALMRFVEEDLAAE